LARLLAEALDGNQDLLDEAHQDGYEAGYKEGYVAACAEK